MKKRVTKKQMIKKKGKVLNTKWINNAMRSIGVSASNVFNEMAPTLFETGKEIGNTINSVKKTVTGTKMSDVTKQISGNKFISLGKQAIDNALADLKSGNFNNEERADDAAARSVLGDNFDDMESMFSDFDDGDSSVTFNYIDEGDDYGSADATLRLADSIDNNTASNLKASKATIDSMIAVSSAGLLQNQEIGNNIIEKLGNIDNTLSSILQYHEENTTQFYEASMAAFERIGGKIDDEYSSDDDKSDATSLFTSKGSINIGEYKKYVKKSMTEAFKGSALGSAVDMIVSNDQFLEMAVSNPLGFATEAIIRGIVPTIVSGTIKNVEDAFAGFMPTMLRKLSDWRNNEEQGLKGNLKRIIGQVFGINIDRTENIDLEGKVTKDPAIFDGITRNAIVEVVPKYLRESTVYLKQIAEHFNVDTEKAKSEAEIYDPNSNSYMKVGDVQKAIAKSITDTVTEAFDNSDFGKAIRQGGSALEGKDAERYKKYIDQFFVMLERSDKAIDFSNPKKANNQLNDVINLLDGTKKDREMLVETIKQLQENQAALHTASAAQMRAQSNRNKELDNLTADYDMRNVLATGINNDTNIDQWVDETMGYQRSIDRRKAEEKQQKKQDEKDARDAKKEFIKQYGVRPSTSKLVQAGFESGTGTNDFKASTDATRAKFKVTDEDSDFVKFFKGTANHVRNGVYGLMTGASPGEIVSEFSAVFTDQIKNMWNGVKENFFKPLAQQLFGQKDENGYSRGGLLSGTQNKIKDMWKLVGYQLNGKGYVDSEGVEHPDKSQDENNETVIGRMKGIFKEIGDSVKFRLFGEDKEGEEGDDKKKGIVNTFTDSLSKGLAGWKEALFGGDDDKDIDETVEDIKKNMVDAIPDATIGATAGAIMGGMAGSSLLGTMIGGPIGGAVVGMAGGLLSRSETFKEYLFGPKDPSEEGKRLGGLISRKTQDLFSNPTMKKSIIGGAALGVVKNMVFGGPGGLMGMLVGGPIGGALIGAGFGLLKESQTFKDFLYGNDEKGRTGIIQQFNKLFGKKEKSSEETRKDTKKMFGMATIGALGGGLTAALVGKVGLLGAMATPFGPIGGAIAGLALGIKAQNSNFKEWLFGKEDKETGKKKGGVLQKFANFMHVEVMSPMKAGMQNMFDDIKLTMEYKILEPIRLAFMPLTKSIAGFADNVKKKITGFVTDMGTTVKKNFIEPIMQNVGKVIIDPIRTVVKTVGRTAYEGTKAVVTLPFTLMKKIADIAESRIRIVTRAIGRSFHNFIIKPIAKTVKAVILNPLKKLFGGLFKMVGGVISAPFKVIGGVATYINNKLDEREARKNPNYRSGGNYRDENRNSRMDYKQARAQARIDKRQRNQLDANRREMARILGYEESEFTEANMKKAEQMARIKGMKKPKWKKVGGLTFDETAEDKVKAKLAQMSNDDIANQSDNEQDIPTRQLSVTQRIFKFLRDRFGKKDSDNNRGDSNNSSDEQNSDNQDNSGNSDIQNPEELLNRLLGGTRNQQNGNSQGNDLRQTNISDAMDEVRADLARNDAARSDMERMADDIENEGGLLRYARNRFNNFRRGISFDAMREAYNDSDLKKGIDRIFKREGRARAEGGDATEGEALLVGDGGTDPDAAEIFVPKTSGTILSQKNGGIKVFIDGISSSASEAIGGAISDDSGSSDTSDDATLDDTKLNDATGGKKGKGVLGKLGGVLHNKKLMKGLSIALPLVGAIFPVISGITEGLSGAIENLDFDDDDDSEPRNNPRGTTRNASGNLQDALVSSGGSTHINAYIDGISTEASEAIGGAVSTGESDNAGVGEVSADFADISAIVSSSDIANSEVKLDSGGNVLPTEVDNNGDATLATLGSGSEARSEKEQEAMEDAARNQAEKEKNLAELTDARNAHSFQTRQAQEALNAQEEREKRRDEILLAQLQETKDANKDSKKHFNLWSSIFSKKGLITGGILAAIPIIMKFFPELVNFIENLDLGTVLKNAISSVLRDFGFGNDNNTNGESAGEKAKDEAEDAAELLKDFPKNPLGALWNYIMGDDGYTDAKSGAKANFIGQHVGKVARVTKKVGKKAFKFVDKLTGKRISKSIAKKKAKAEAKKATNKAVKKVLRANKRSEKFANFKDNIANKIANWKTNRRIKAAGGMPESAELPWRQTVTNSADDVGEAATKGVTKSGKAVVDKSISRKAIENGTAKPQLPWRTGLNSTADDIGEAAGKAVLKNSDDVGEAAGKTVTKTFGKKVTKKAASESLESGSKSLLGKALEALSTGWDNMINSISSKLASSGGKIGTKLGSSKLVSGAKGLLGKVVGCVTKHFPRISAKIAAVLGTSGALIASGVGAVVEVVKNAGGAIILGVNEASNPRNLFYVDSNYECDWIMYAIAAGIGAIKGTTPGSVIDIINELVASILGLDMIHELACIIYNLVCNVIGQSEKFEKLTEGKEKQKSEYTKYKESEIKKQYSAYAKSKGKTEEEYTMDQYKADLESGAATLDVDSFVDFNHKQNKTIGAKVTDAAVGVGKNIAKGWKSLGGYTTSTFYDETTGITYEKNEDDTYTMYDKSGKNLGKIAEDNVDTTKMKETKTEHKGTAGKTVSALVGTVNDVVGGVGGAIIDRGKSIINGAVDGAKIAGSGISSGFKQMTDGDFLGGGATMLASIGAGAGRFGQGVVDGGKKMMSGIGNAVLDLGNGIVNTAKGLGSDIVNIGKGIGKGITNFFTSESEEVYRNPQDGSYYRTVDGKWILHNNNGDKISDTPLEDGELISLVRAGTLVQDKIMTRKSGLQKTKETVLQAFSDAKTAVIDTMKSAGNALKDAGKWVNDKLNDAGKAITDFGQKVEKGIHDFFISDTEQVYRNPQDGTYYKNVDGNWILHNNNGDKISDTPLENGELISLVRAGALVQDTITTRESGLQKTGKAILTTFNNAKTTVWNAMKKTGNALKDAGTWISNKASDAGKAITDFGKKTVNYFTSQSKDVYMRNDGSGSFYDSEGKHYTGNGERVAEGDITPELLNSMISNGLVTKTERKVEPKALTDAKAAFDKIGGGILDAWNATKKFGSNVAKNASKFGKAVAKVGKKVLNNGKKMAYKAILTVAKEVYVNPDGSYYDSEGKYYTAQGDPVEANNISQEDLYNAYKSGVVTKKLKPDFNKIKNIGSSAMKTIKGGLKSAWKGLSTFGSNIKDGVDKAGKMFTKIGKTIKDKGLIGAIGGLFETKTKEAWYAPDGSYYTVNKDGTYTHYSATNDVLEENISGDAAEEIDLKISSGVFKKDTITEQSAASKAISGIKEEISKGWENAQSIVTSGWNSIKNGLSGIFGGNGGFGGAGGFGEVIKNFKENLNSYIPKRKPKEIGGYGPEDGTVNGFKYYSQKDAQWANAEYSSSKAKDNATVGEAGCGPTAMAMVASQYSGKTVTPVDMAKLAERGGFRDETGTNSNFISYAGNKYNIQNTRVDDPGSEYIKRELAKGNSVVLNGVNKGMPNSPFTSKGHYVVAVGTDKDGNIIVNDPRGAGYSTSYSPDVIQAQTRMAWSFNKPKKGETVEYIKSNRPVTGGAVGPKLIDPEKLSKKERKKLEKELKDLKNGKKGDKKSDTTTITTGTTGTTQTETQSTEGNWLAIVQAVKKAIADQHPGYSKKNWITISVGGRSMKVRTDCSGYVGSCLKYLGVIPESSNPVSGTFASSNYPSLSSGGFTHMPFTNWESLQTGDIIALDGHVEIFAWIKDGTHYVFNCGSNDSVNSPVPTRSGHSSYTSVWRPNNPGSLDGTLSVDTVMQNGTNGGATVAGPSNESQDVTSIITSHFNAFANKAMTGMLTGKWDNDFSNVMNSGTSTSTASAGATMDGGVDASAANIQGNDTKEKVWNFFTSNGYSPEATAGIMGNMEQESGVDPAAIQGHGKGPAAGIVQWENYNTKSSRWKDLSDYAESKGYKWSDLEPQLEFIVKELNTKDIDDRMQGKTSPQNLTKAGATPMSFSAWKQSTDIENATRLFEGAYERGGTLMMPNRLNAARKYYDMYNGKTGGKGGDDEKPFTIRDIDGVEDDPMLMGAVGGFGDSDVTVDETSTFRNESINSNTRDKINNINLTQNSTDTSKMESLLSKMISILESIDSHSGESAKNLKSLDVGKSTNIKTGDKITIQQNSTNPIPEKREGESRNTILANKIAKGY